MSEYKKTALVLGAGGFIGELIWLKDFGKKDIGFVEWILNNLSIVIHANEFIQGDLRDTKFVARCIRYAGETGNFYAQIVDKFLEPFDEIYQFAVDMGGAGFCFHW